jgi:hypothetical protein
MRIPRVEGRKHSPELSDAPRLRQCSRKAAVSRPAPVVTEFWVKFVAKSDKDPEEPEHGAVYIFFDREDNLNRDASETCKTPP